MRKLKHSKILINTCIYSKNTEFIHLQLSGSSIREPAEWLQNMLIYAAVGLLLQLDPTNYPINIMSMNHRVVLFFNGV